MLQKGWHHQRKSRIVLGAILVVILSSTGVLAGKEKTFYFDGDGDGFGDSLNTVSANKPPPGYVRNGDDCNDIDANIHPQATDLCGDGIDQNCDGSDEPCGGTNTFYQDSDGDGYGNPGIWVEDISPPEGYVTDGTDCDDGDAAVHPAADEICGDSIDQDCSGNDPACSAGKGKYYFYKDADGDGFGDPNDTVVSRKRPSGYVNNNVDCDDTAAAVNPAANEICGDGIDQDCSGGDVACPIITFEKTFGGMGSDQGRSVEQTTDGGYVMAGITDHDANGSQHRLYAIRADEYGNEVWSHNYPDTWGVVPMRIRQTTDGGFILLGSGEIIYSGLGSQMMLVKLDGEGSEEWRRYIGGSSVERGHDLQLTTDGGFILFGLIRSPEGYYDYYLVKTDGLGNEQWNRTFGGSNHEMAYGVNTTADGGYVLIGYTLSFGAGNRDYYLVKTDSAGNEEWSQTFGGTGSDEGRSVEQTADGGFVVLGTAALPGYQMHLIKTDSLGNEEWSQSYGTSGTYGEAVRQTSDGGYALAGTRYLGYVPDHQVSLVRTDTTGVQLWSTEIGRSGNEFGYGIDLTNDGGYVIVGRTESIGAGNYDVYIIKTDDSGNLSRLFFRDTDGDGYGDRANTTVGPTAPPGYVLESNDCDDTDPNAYPGAPEIPGDGIDQDCDGIDPPAL